MASKPIGTAVQTKTITNTKLGVALAFLGAAAAFAVAPLAGGGCFGSQPDITVFIPFTNVVEVCSKQKVIIHQPEGGKVVLQARETTASAVTVVSVGKDSYHFTPSPVTIEKKGGALLATSNEYGASHLSVSYLGLAENHKAQLLFLSYAACNEYTGKYGESKDYGQSGINPDTAGWIAAFSWSFGESVTSSDYLSDSCGSTTSTEDTLNEYFCNASLQPVSKLIDCSESGQICLDGSCVDVSPVSTPSSTLSAPVSCVDSDGGNKPLTKGTASVTVTSSLLPGALTTGTDLCVSQNTVHEFFCTNATSTPVGGANVICPTGTVCLGNTGACLPVSSSTSTPSTTSTL